MVRTPVSKDTSPAAQRVLDERFRAMTVADRVELVTELNATIEKLARAGIAAQYPAYNERETCRELVRRRYGAALAEAAYGPLD